MAGREKNFRLRTPDTSDDSSFSSFGTNKSLASDTHRISNSGTYRGIDFAPIDHLSWHVVAIDHHLENIRAIFARALGVSGPQYLILSALRDLDRDSGVSVSTVSAKLLVDASFVTTQSKALEKMGLVRRAASPADARVVLMSLTDKCRKQFASLATLSDYSNSLAFAGWKEDTLRDFFEKLGSLSQRLARTAIIVAAEN